ncbi:GALK1 [Anthophora retusa]
MNRKSRNIHTVCADTTVGNLSNHKIKFSKDYYELVKPYIDRDISEKLESFPSLEELTYLAEQEFMKHYGLFPTCATYAPGCLTIAGKNTDLAESKSLSMAIQLVTLVVGKRSHGNKWCQVKTLSDEIAGEKTFKLSLKDENLHVSTEETSWIRYLKGTIRSFKDKGAHVPGFQIVIASSLPVKCGLGSSSALVVALYTFLEAITSMYTRNVMEKTLACHFAEKIAAASCRVRITDVLTSVLGKVDKISLFDTRSLRIDRFDWNAIDVELIFIELVTVEKSQSPEWCTNDTCYKEIMTVMNTTSQWRTHPLGTSMMEFLFSRKTMQINRNIIDQDERIMKMTDSIRKQRWKEWGKLLWENHHSVCKTSNFLSNNIGRIMNMLENIEGVLGASVIGYGASIITLVQRSTLNNVVSFLNRTKNSQQRFYIMKSFTGASTLYTYERRLEPWDIKHVSRLKLIIKYHLSDKDDNDTESYHKELEKLSVAISLFIPRKSIDL